jgi:hypothetical protein
MTPPHLHDPPRLQGLAYGLSLAGSAGLLLMGIYFMLDRPTAAALFGVPLSGGSSDVYLVVAAVRDVAFGALALAFALWRDRRAVGLSVLFGAIIPTGDGFVVLMSSPTPAQHLPLHWGGAAACVVFGLYLLRERGGNAGR